MFYIISSITFLVLLGFIYTLLMKERKSIKISLFSYFLVLSIVFIAGHIYISSTYHLNSTDMPIDGGFAQLLKWVSLFSYALLIPLFILIGYKTLKFVNKTFSNAWIKTIAFSSWIIVLAGITWFLPEMFILIFYGVGP